jgi:hypothetical protein
MDPNSIWVGLAVLVFCVLVLLIEHAHNSLKRRLARLEFIARYVRCKHCDRRIEMNLNDELACECDDAEPSSAYKEDEEFFEEDEEVPQKSDDVPSIRTTPREEGGKHA